MRGKAGDRYLIGDENLTWQDWITQLLKFSGVKKRVSTLPDLLVKVGLLGVAGWHKVRGVEGGLAPRHFLNLRTYKTYFDPSPAQQALGFEDGTLENSSGRRSKSRVYDRMNMI